MELQHPTIARTRLATGRLLALLLLLAPLSSAQIANDKAWPILEVGLRQKSSAERLTAIRVLGLIPDDPHAVELAEKALRDPSGPVRAAAATALGQMHASDAETDLKQALNDKEQFGDGRAGDEGTARSEAGR